MTWHFQRTTFERNLTRFCVTDNDFCNSLLFSVKLFSFSFHDYIHTSVLTFAVLPENGTSKLLHRYRICQLFWPYRLSDYCTRTEVFKLLTELMLSLYVSCAIWVASIRAGLLPWYADQHIFCHTVFSYILLAVFHFHLFVYFAFFIYVVKYILFDLILYFYPIILTQLWVNCASDSACLLTLCAL